MSNRQLRISHQAEISKRIHDFIGKRIHIVLKDSTSFFGILRQVSSGSIILENMRTKTVSHDMTTIAEIYIDSQT
jgi:small nuclear ribonucleoprotein (snRNP)-like protein